MRTFAAALIALVPAALVLADLELDPDDVPEQCNVLCQPVVDLGRLCAVHNDTIDDEREDLLEKQCVCTNESFDVRGRTALCASCIEQHSNDDTDGEGEGSNDP
jgi:hypothetical protein